MPTVITDLPKLAPRPVEAHKGRFGRILIVAGSRGMSGAAILAGLGALRGGAGLVRVATPLESQPIVAGYHPCYLTAGLSSGADGRFSLAAEEELLELAANCDILALGPGLGQSDAITHLVKTVLAKVEKPLVLDADGLNALAQLLPPRPCGRELSGACPLILTPHPGEFCRLRRISKEELEARREELATDFASTWKVVLALKGHQSLVTDGARLYRNRTGNPGMATGGTGDVLAGLIAALLGQGLAAFEATQLGVYLHGLAGDIARDELGEVALTALDVAERLPAALARR